jgi:predicted acyl esterase
MSTTIQTLKDRFPDIKWTPLPPPEVHPHWNYEGFKPGTTVLRAGHRKVDEFRAFGVDTVFERDVGVRMRDGVTLCTDVFRPEGARVPAIIAWSPYGKQGGPSQYATFGGGVATSVRFAASKW